MAERVFALTLTDPPTEATHWTATMMAKATGNFKRGNEKRR